MEREVSSITMLGVSMVAMAALLTVVMFAFNLGQMIKGSALETIDNTAQSVEDIELNSMAVRGKDARIPITTALYIINNNIDKIEDIECNLCGTYVYGPSQSGVCLNEHLRGRDNAIVNMEVVYNKTQGQYRIKIHKADCKYYKTDLAQSNKALNQWSDYNIKTNDCPCDNASIKVDKTSWDLVD